MEDLVVVTSAACRARVYGENFSSRPCILMTVPRTPNHVKARAALWPYFHERGKYLAERGEQPTGASHPLIS